MGSFGAITPHGRISNLQETFSIRDSGDFARAFQSWLYFGDYASFRKCISRVVQTRIASGNLSAGIVITANIVLITTIKKISWLFSNSWSAARMFRKLAFTACETSKLSNCIYVRLLNFFITTLTDRNVTY